MQKLIIYLLLTLLLANCKKDNAKAISNNKPLIPMDTFSPIHVKYLALGDSYTIGQSVSQAESFPFQLSKILNATDSIKVTSTKVIAKTGWTTQNLITAIGNETLTDSFDLITLLIGVNNQYQGRDTTEYALQFEQLLNTSIKLAQGKKSRVIVVSIPDYGYTPFGQGNQQNISKAIDIFNAINYRIAYKNGIKYFDITPISRSFNADLVASDGLHPSGKQYGLWVDLMQKEIKQLLLQ